MPDNGNQSNQVQKPTVKSWIQGGASFKVTHYSYAVEDDPFYANHGLTDMVTVPELNNRQFSRGFLGINKDGSILPSSKNVGVTMQGTGQTLQGDHIMYAGKSGGKATFAFGVGGAHATVTRPFEQIAVDPTVIPYGSKVYVEAYDKVMSADDTGGAIKGKHIDIFAGPQTYGNICRLLGGVQSSRLGLVDANTPTSGGGNTTTATTQNKPAQNSPAQAPANQAQANSAAGTVYTVVSGDTLSGIAAKFNVAGGFQVLATYNGISNPRMIRVGQKIVIPGNGNTAESAPKPQVSPEPQAVQAQPSAAQDTYYTVVSGDTLSKIAKKFNVPGGYMTIANANGITNPNIINVGQKLRIPA
ncbi:MAG: LysM peptidoglycan-binding domain-containing protein [Proteobacteria bacterium]|nr:LysM peptidoglycan-binding domain-containing protein [Pseudomonadota bacterium]